MNAYKFAYIGRKPDCGCVVAIIVDMPEYKKDVAKQVAEFIRDGLEIERVDLDAGKQELHSCPHGKVSSAQKALL